MIAGLAFFNFYWGGSCFVQWLPMVCKWLLIWRFQFLLRWFIFCTMISYGVWMIAGLAFFNFYWGGSYFVQWLPMVCGWLLVWLFSIFIEVVHILYNDCLWYDCWFGFFQFLLRWFIFCTMIAYGMIAGLAFFNFYWGGSYFVQWLPMVWLLVWLFSIFIEVVHILYNYAYGMIAGLAFFNFYWGGSYLVQLCLWYDCWYGVFNFYRGGSYFVQLCLWYDCWCGVFNFYWGGLYFVQWLPMVWLLVWCFQFLLRWFIFCTMIAYGMIAGMAFSIFIEVVHILYNDCLWYDCWYGVFNFYWGGLYFVQWLPMVWLLVWRFQFLLRWFIFCTMIAYGMIAGLAFSIFIEVVHILYNDCLWYDCWYGVFNFYRGGSYFVQWLPMVWLLV